MKVTQDQAETLEGFLRLALRALTTEKDIDRSKVMVVNYLSLVHTIVEDSGELDSVVDLDQWRMAKYVAEFGRGGY